MAIPSDLLSFFNASVAAGAALVGLLFLAISIAPKETVEIQAPIAKQALATTAFTALLNPFVISLFSLNPQIGMGFVVLALAVIGISTTLRIAYLLLRDRLTWQDIARRVVFVLMGLLLYGFECLAAFSLLSTSSHGAYYQLVTLLCLLYIYGLYRAWELLGARHYRWRDWLSILRRTGEGK